MYIYFLIIITLTKMYNIYINEKKIKEKKEKEKSEEKQRYLESKRKSK